MPRYIDAEVALQSFCAECNHTIKCEDCDIKYHLETFVPTADVAEVVRCKDCRYVFKEDEYSYWCNGFTSPMRLVTPETFCSHGRRKND